MSLYTRMLNSNATVTVNEAAYGHEEGAFTIAMESAQELYAIFRESTYESEQAELAAVSEGVVLEGSQYEVVQENAIKNGFAKIKEFLQKLWAKVKAFFASVVKFLDGIFKSGKDFATKYEKQLKALKLNGFEYKMYKYNNAKIDGTFDATLGEYLLETAKEEVVAIHTNKSYEGEGKDYKKKLEKDVEAYRKAALGVTDKEDEAEAIFGMFRSGAKNETDKEDVKINISEIIKVLKDSKADNIKTIQGKTDQAYSKAIKLIDDAATKADKEEGRGAKVAEVLRAYSSYLSQEQTIENAIISGMKTAFTERNNTYKKVCLAAFKYKEEK